MKFCKSSFTIMALMLATFSSAQIVELKLRCEEDNLNPDQARERFNWLKSCHQNILTDFHDSLFPEFRADPAPSKIKFLEDEWLHSRGQLRARPKYLTFGLADNSNPHNWQAPVSSTAACGLPTGYIPLGLCTSSCYHPSQTVLFEDGMVPIKEAFSSKLNRIISVADHSALDSLAYSNRPVEAYTESLRETQHQLVKLTMQSGGELIITLNHPLLKSDGKMVEAQDLQLGDQLLDQDGHADPIVTKDMQAYFGKVYNVSPVASSPEGHILVAEGYLSGSSWYQNDGIDHINRIILRANIPDEFASHE